MVGTVSKLLWPADLRWGAWDQEPQVLDSEATNSSEAAFPGAPSQWPSAAGRLRHTHSCMRWDSSDWHFSSRTPIGLARTSFLPSLASSLGSDLHLRALPATSDPLLIFPSKSHECLISFGVCFSADPNNAFASKTCVIYLFEWAIHTHSTKFKQHNVYKERVL